MKFLTKILFALFVAVVLTPTQGATGTCTCDSRSCLNNFCSNCQFAWTANDYSFSSPSAAACMGSSCVGPLQRVEVRNCMWSPR